MASDLEKKVANELSTVEKMSKYDFEPYWPAKKLRICITGKMQQPTRCWLSFPAQHHAGHSLWQMQ